MGLGNFNNLILNANNDKIFKTLCINGHLDMAKWVYELYEAKGYQKLNTDGIHCYLKISVKMVILRQQNGYINMII